MGYLFVVFMPAFPAWYQSHFCIAVLAVVTFYHCLSVDTKWGQNRTSCTTNLYNKDDW